MHHHHETSIGDGLIRDGLLIKDGSGYTLTEEFLFSSPSNVTSAVLA